MRLFLISLPIHADTAEALDIKVDMTSNHPRRLFSAASSAGASSASSTSSTAPKRRSPRKGDTTSRVGWGSSDLHNDLCEVCDMDGDLLCCDSCSLVFHLSCVRPCISTVPEGDWICAYCELDQERSPSQQVCTTSTTIQINIPLNISCILLFFYGCRVDLVAHAAGPPLRMPYAR